MEDGNQEVVNSLVIMRSNLDDKLKKALGTKLQIPKHETAFTEYYTVEKRNEISKLFERNEISKLLGSSPEKKAAKLGFELVYTVNMQFDL